METQKRKSVLFTAPLISFMSPASTGQWIAIREYDTPVKAMLYDGETGKTTIWEAKNGSFEKSIVNGAVTLKGMMWPQSQYFFKLRWTVLEADKATAEAAVYQDGPNKGKKLYKSVRTFEHSDIVIGVRSEDNMPYLRKKEVHPIAIEFNCTGGGSYVIIAQITTIIENPLVSIQLEHLLDAGIGRVTEAILNWGKSMTFDKAQAIDVDDHKQITLKNKKGRQEFYLNVINEHLKTVGLNIPDVTILDHFIGDNSKEVFKNMNQTLIEEDKVEQAKFKSAARLELNKATEVENATELKYDVALLAAIQKTETAILDKKALVANAYVKNGKLEFLNVSGSDGAGTSVAEMFFAMKKQKNTTNATT